MVIDTLRKVTKEKKTGSHTHTHTLNKTDEKEKQDDDELICSNSTKLMTFILLSTNAQDKNDRLNELIVCPFAMPNDGKHGRRKNE